MIKQYQKLDYFCNKYTNCNSWRLRWCDAWSYLSPKALHVRKLHAHSIVQFSSYLHCWFQIVICIIQEELITWLSWFLSHLLAIAVYDLNSWKHQYEHCIWNVKLPWSSRSRQEFNGELNRKVLSSLLLVLPVCGDQVPIGILRSWLCRRE